MPWTAGLTVRVFTHERAHTGRRRVVEALIALAQEQRLAGVTVTRALTEAATQGEQRDGAPVIVEMADRAARIEAALPQIAALIPQGALSVTETRIYLPASRLRASDALEQAVFTAQPDDPASAALDALLHHGARLIPVLDAERRPIGVITLTHLLAQVNSDLAAHLLTLSQPEHMRDHLLLHIEEKRVRDLMRSPALSVRDDASLDSVARTLTERHITRALVTDGHGRYLGIVSEHALVKLLLHGLLLSDADALHLPHAHAESRAALAGSVEPTGGEPLTSGACADTSVPLLAETASWEESTSATEESGVALVVDAQGRLRGVIEEAALLERATDAPQAGGLAALRRVLAQATGQREQMASRQTGDLGAGALSQPARLIERPDTPLALALAHIVATSGADYAVIATEDARPTGILWRQDALRALVGG